MTCNRARFLKVEGGHGHFLVKETCDKGFFLKNDMLHGDPHPWHKPTLQLSTFVTVVQQAINLTNKLVIILFLANCY